MISSIEFTTSYPLTFFANFFYAAVWIGLASVVTEPWRQRSQSAILAVAAVSYLLGAFMGWVDLVGAVVVLSFALLGVKKYWALGAGWMAHTVVDVIHHSAGMPMMTSLPLSSFGCAVLDPLLAAWFFAGAPSVWTILGERWRRRSAGAPGTPRNMNAHK